LNGNFGKITRVMRNSRFHVVPFTKLVGGIHAICVQQEPVQLKRSKVTVLSKDDTDAEHMRLYVEFITAKHIENIDKIGQKEYYCAERRDELEEIYRLKGKYMQPMLLVDYAYLVGTDYPERALKLFKESYYPPQNSGNPELSDSSKFIIVIFVSQLLIELKRPHAALDTTELAVPITQEQREHLLESLESIVKLLKLDVCAEKVWKRILELKPTRNSREKLGAYYQAQGHMEAALNLYNESGEDPEYIRRKTSNLKKIIEKGNYQVSPGTCTRSTEEPFSWKE